MSSPQLQKAISGGTQGKFSGHMHIQISVHLYIPVYLYGIHQQDLLMNTEQGLFTNMHLYVYLR
jgi:hypothetical protein